MKASFRNVLVLTVLLAAAAVWVWSQQNRTGAEPEHVGELLFPELPARLNDIERIELQSAGESFAFVRQGGEWTVESWGGFPASFEKLKEVAYGVSRLQVLQPMTARPSGWGELQVQEPAEGNTALRVRLQAGGATLADVVVGRSAGRNEVFVRRSGEDQTWKASGSLLPPKEANGYVEREILAVPAARVARVTIEHPDGERVDLSRTGGGSNDWALAAIPEGMEITAPGLLAQAPGAIARLELDAVAPAAEVDALGSEWTSTRFETEDGLEIVVRTTKDAAGEKTYARLSVAALPRPEGEDVGPPEPADAADEPASDEKSPEEIAAEAAGLQAKVAPWTYVIPSWRSDNLRKRMADLVRVPPPPEPELDANEIPPGLSGDGDLGELPQDVLDMLGGGQSDG